MTTKTALDQARILAAHLRTKQEQDFLQAFLKEAELQNRPSAHRYVNTLWTRFLSSTQGQTLLVVQEAKPQDMQEARMLRVIRGKLEQGGRLLPRERDLVEALSMPAKQATTDPELLQRIQGVLDRLAPKARSDRDARALCGHLQQWLRKQGKS